MRTKIIVSVVLAITAATARAEPTRDYIVRQGDTCVAISIRELGGRDQLEVIHRLNPGMGPTPHNLKPGEILKLPLTRIVEPDAHLADQQGRVEVRPAGDETWIHATTGADLFRAWRVGAREHATAQVAFADRSAIAMRENTVVVIFGPTRTDIRTFRASLERGTLRTRLADLDGRAVVESTSGVTTLASGSAVLDVDRVGTTRVSNHAGKPADVTSRIAKPKTVHVAPGFGSQVAVGSDPTPPRPLPRSPAWAAKPSLVVGWAGAGGVVRASWGPVPRAKSYRIELARDRELSKVDVRVEVAGDVTVFEAREVPTGVYWISVAAVDDTGFESAPSEVAEVKVVELRMPQIASAGTTPRVPVGSVLSIPEGLRCGFDGEPKEIVLVARGEGARQVVCTAPDGATASAELVVAAVRAAHADPVRIALGKPTSFDVAIDAAMPPAGSVTARPPPGFVVESTERTPTGARFRVRAEPTVAAGTAKLSIVLAPNLAGAADIELGSVDLVVESSLVVAESRTRRGAFALDLLGVASSGDDRVASGARFGAAIDVTASNWVAADLGVWRAPTRDAAGWFSVGVSVGPPGAIRPLIRGGMIKSFGTSDPGGYIGAGIAVRLTRRVSGLVIVDGLTDGSGERVQGGIGARIKLE